MKIPKYQENTNLFEFKTIVTEQGNDEKGGYIVLQDTIFYPQGGGQPYDTGLIYSGDISFIISEVFYNSESASIRHYGFFDSLKVSDEIILNINKERRLLNSKNHTAGHLLTFAVEKLVENKEIKGVKGYHFPEGCYIEFNGLVEIESEIIENEVKQLIKQNLKIVQNFISKEEFTRLTDCGIDKIPNGKSIRIMGVGSNGVLLNVMGCGGTHLSNTVELENFSIRKISNKKGISKISYSTI
jgi:Ser-tRNA(Ala) deacylase AlaX